MIIAKDISKIYKIYKSPIDRLKEALLGKKKLYYQEYYALQGISFEIQAGETIGIIGRNGSGKSTLLKILAGVLTPSTGYIQVEGKVSAILELGAGFNVEYTGLENIYLNGVIQGKTNKQIEEVVDRIVDFADIGEFIYQPVKTYSSGMFARLAFAVAINVDPDIIIVDEALAVGDMKFQAKCFRKFEELKEKGVTILFVGHDISSIRKFCDRTLWLHKGKMVAFGDTLNVTAEYMEFMNTEQEDVTNLNLSTSIDVSASVTDIQSRESSDEDSLNNIINRWGSRPNLIKNVKVMNEKGQKTQILKHGETVRISVTFLMPDDLPREHVSVAISLKDPTGTDLIVYTTKDDDRIRFDPMTHMGELTFEFKNILTNVDIVLAVAIEDRSTLQPEYYDFVEGAAYFKSVTDKQLFGVAHPPVHKHLRKVE